MHDPAWRISDSWKETVRSVLWSGCGLRRYRERQAHFSRGAATLPDAASVPGKFSTVKGAQTPSKNHGQT